MTKPDKYQLIRMAIAVDHYDNYMRTNDIEYLELYANVSSKLYHEGIDFSAYEILKALRDSKKQKGTNT